jgi:hypothetical protein
VNNGHLLVAYHGCDITVRDGFVTGALIPEPSENKYDWLGPGIYFFEGDETRARHFAANAHAHPTKRYTNRPIATPAVVGVVLCVNNTLDVTTRAGLTEFSDAYKATIFGWESENIALGKRPKNGPARNAAGDVLQRELDCAVFKVLHKDREDQRLPPYQMVRGAFRQGEALAPDSGLHKDSHVQIALREASCIVGWFLPPGDKLLTGKAKTKARADYAAAVEAYPAEKEHIRAING